ncbi:probable G-protein coupled receptor 174 isoform X3 [Equus asinus]|uniref:probable G-protein coupled receptor 174 isoform X3 n=1 Tax=Equus asinus TaxID=9793 RepID=UPI0038F6A446
MRHMKRLKKVKGNWIGRSQNKEPELTHRAVVSSLEWLWHEFLEDLWRKQKETETILETSACPTHFLDMKLLQTRIYEKRQHDWTLFTSELCLCFPLFSFRHN